MVAQRFDRTDAKRAALLLIAVTVLGDVSRQLGLPGSVDGCIVLVYDDSAAAAAMEEEQEGSWDVVTDPPAVAVAATDVAATDVADGANEDDFRQTTDDDDSDVDEESAVAATASCTSYSNRQSFEVNAVTKKLRSIHVRHNLEVRTPM